MEKNILPFSNDKICCSILDVTLSIKSNFVTKIRQICDKVKKSVMKTFSKVSQKYRLFVTGHFTIAFHFNLCNFCTGCFAFQFLHFIDIVDVADNGCSVRLKQLRHLWLSQPHCIILHADIHLRLSVLRLIYDYLVVLAHSTLLFPFCSF